MPGTVQYEFVNYVVIDLINSRLEQWVAGGRQSPTTQGADGRVIAAALQALADPASGIRPSRRRLAVLVTDSRNLQSDETRCQDAQRLYFVGAS